MAPSLGDRIVNIRCTNIPLGLRGTVVAIHPSTSCVEVVMDAEFIGGQNLNGLCKKGRGRLVKWSEVLSLSKVETVKIPHNQSRQENHSMQSKPAWKKPDDVNPEKKKGKSAPRKKQMYGKGNGVAPAADDGLAKLLQNAKVSATVKSPAAQAKVSENKDNGNLKDLIDKGRRFACSSTANA